MMLLKKTHEEDNGGDWQEIKGKKSLISPEPKPHKQKFYCRLLKFLQVKTAARRFLPPMPVSISACPCLFLWCCGKKAFDRLICAGTHEYLISPPNITTCVKTKCWKRSARLKQQGKALLILWLTDADQYKHNTKRIIKKSLKSLNTKNVTEATNYKG